jgi:hypothetical protein
MGRVDRERGEEGKGGKEGNGIGERRGGKMKEDRERDREDGRRGKGSWFRKGCALRVEDIDRIN